MTPPLSWPPGDALHTGRHRIHLEPPDHLVFVADGDLTADDVLYTHEVIAAFEQDKKQIFLLVDLAQIGSIPADARKAGARPNAAQRLCALAVYGATFTQRVVILLVVTAFRLRKGGDFPQVSAFNTEAEARAWLAERRRAVLQTQ